MPEIIDEPIEGAVNSRKDDVARKICARDEEPRTGNSGEHCSMSHSHGRTHPQERTRRGELRSKL